ncbi:Phytanoyl-CoA dioxygenase [Gluconacetobacter diazotrophicus PA1 5]|uniref:Phytanoyl-CoA dioxygenase n=1 Tax=Gluconacetobacter diazotrophicus TaxID=33996 RepID=A0A7W4I618_GLUDI|nr:phytanoyl-CoA dioxygenase family protein [Gluconacetobacter diazotrophicus]ACI52156.1 Phytanoyl-CoA dioxygenase [Gluconacetobacter diazotrophicus PA1 5]MBB2156918.1 phytanoyl-CoA dioxygenase [Gluconacetobacter diazotrophicus]TWB02517.1 ectoine hydroxylase-related dioxygenase (phytanoyl-CoA dioxygenase family) [Gluconacetobacter diazotrophicus]
MKNNESKTRTQPSTLTQADCDLPSFRKLVERTADPAHYPHAHAIERNIPIYDGQELAALVRNDAERAVAVKSELCALLADGPGVAVFRGAMDDPGVLDQASSVFGRIIDEERRTQSGGGDHFAKPGANDRVWNALEKHCLEDPGNFARYYANPVIALLARAWLGPAYQVTAQVNRVNPGGGAQAPHRDYHLGFQSPDAMAHYPRHVHQLSPMLTLQGAVAHVDMPLESGPTLFLPYSQTYLAGYLAVTRPDFVEYFHAHHVQLPLSRGDMVFFNPALFHAAGANRSRDIGRLANLLQISSAFGRAMETVNRTRMCAALYSALGTLKSENILDLEGIGNTVAACAEGYSFPTNLDRDPPLHNLAPRTQAQLMHEALDERWSEHLFVEALLAQDARKKGE